MHNHSNGNELRILMQIKTISLTIVEHQDSLRNRDKQQLRNGPLYTQELSETESWINNKTRKMITKKLYLYSVACGLELVWLCIFLQGKGDLSLVQPPYNSLVMNNPF